MNKKIDGTILFLLAVDVFFLSTIIDGIISGHISLLLVHMAYADPSWTRHPVWYAVALLEWFLLFFFVGFLIWKAYYRRNGFDKKE